MIRRFLRRLFHLRYVDVGDTVYHHDGDLFRPPTY